jgi:hypothetical protein
VSYAGGTLVRERAFSGDRDEIQIAAAYAAMDLVRRVATGGAEAAETEPHPESVAQR